MCNTVIVWLDKDLLYPSSKEALPPPSWNLLIGGKEHPVYAAKL